MNKKVVIGAIVLLVPLYVAASWGLGRSAHAQFDAFEQRWNAQPVAILKITERTYTPGVFTSEERFTFELNEEFFGELLESKGEAAGIDSLESDTAELEDAADESVASDSVEFPRLTVLHKVQHGPFPGFRSFGLARIESTLELSEEARAEIAEVFGEKEPLFATTLIGLTGAGSTTVSSPAFELDKDGEKLSWQGVEGKVDFGRNLSSLECDLKAPGMELTENGTTARLGELSFECDLERAFDSLYMGTAAIRIASMHHATPTESMQVEQISYATDMRKNGDYFDMALAAGVGSMAMKGLTMSELRYDLAFNHLHGPTYAAMQRKMEESMTGSALNDTNASAAALVAALGEYVPQLLEHSPQLVINRIGFSMPEGEAGFKGTIQLKDFSKDDLANGTTMALLTKLDASADLWLSEALLMRDWTTGASATADEVSEGPSAAEKLAMMQMQVAQLEQQGYITRSGDRLESHIEFKNGALTANGQPLGPMAGAQ